MAGAANWTEPERQRIVSDPPKTGQRDITTGLCKRHSLPEVTPYCRVAVRTLVDDAWQILTDEVLAADGATPEQVQSAEQAHKDYIRASKEYLSIAFKKRFLER